MGGGPTKRSAAQAARCPGPWEADLVDGQGATEPYGRAYQSKGVSTRRRP
jgi:hypothetical protein